MPPLLLVMAVDMQRSTIWVIYHSYKIHPRRHKEDKKRSVIHLMYSWMYLCRPASCWQWRYYSLISITSFVPLGHFKTTALTPEAQRCTVSVCMSVLIDSSSSKSYRLTVVLLFDFDAGFMCFFTWGPWCVSFHRRKALWAAFLVVQKNCIVIFHTLMQIVPAADRPTGLTIASANYRHTSEHKARVHIITTCCSFMK